MTRLPSSIALAFLLALSAHAEPDGGVMLERVVLDVELATLKITDAGTMEVVGGCWLDERTCIDLGRAKVAAKAEGQALKSSAIPPPSWLAVAIGGAFVLGVTVGVVGVVVVRPR